MNKDVIYIDVEDDITAIIGKVKDSKEKIIALVPPKRIGILQSAVNLHLLARAATQNNKHLVLISSNPALITLASAAKIPVAKNLQSKPELAEIAALDIDDREDVIDGNNLPVGDHVKMASSDSAIENALRADAANISRATPPAPGQSLNKPKAKTGIKVPNFDSFRKRLVLMIGGGVLLIGLGVWAIFFAPHATVLITARTSDSSVNSRISLLPAADTDLAKSTIKSTLQQTKKDISADFDVTGTKDVGTKATGSMTITRSGVSDSASTIPSGTQFTNGSIVFVSTADAVVPRSQIVGSSLDNGSVTIVVTAAAIGEEYNLSARTYQSSVSGYTAHGTDMSGGAKHKAKVVSADDIQKATDQLKQQNVDEMKKQLTSQFDAATFAISQTFKVDIGTPVAVPALDQESTSGKAKLSASVTYSIIGIANNESSRFLDNYFAKQIESKNDQRVYDNGAKKISYTNISPIEGGFAANIVATAKIGPKIDDAAIKDLAKGKRFGEIQAAIESIQGVDNVDVKFSPFWVSAAPNDASKISIEFKLNESK